jgi:hypothetical protein
VRLVCSPHSGAMPFIFEFRGDWGNSASGSRLDAVERRIGSQKCWVRWLRRSRIGDEAGRKSDRDPCAARAGLGGPLVRGGEGMRVGTSMTKLRDCLDRLIPERCLQRRRLHQLPRRNPYNVAATAIGNDVTRGSIDGIRFMERCRPLSVPARGGQPDVLVLPSMMPPMAEGRCKRVTS